jgi:hypothetical protein
MLLVLYNFAKKVITLSAAVNIIKLFSALLMLLAAYFLMILTEIMPIVA